MVPAVHGNRAFVMTNGGRLLGVHITPPEPFGPREPRLRL